MGFQPPTLRNIDKDLADWGDCPGQMDILAVLEQDDE